MNRKKEIFERAVEFDSLEERQRYVEEASAGDEVLCARVEELLRAHDEFPDFLPEKLSVETGENLSLTQPIEEAIGERVGPYTLREKIGEGGWGVVYIADQEKPVRRRVAIKMLKLGMDTREVMARFDAERQALAMMEHPNIARVFDAGATESGRPYFAMELALGMKITAYCDEECLDIRGRLELFLEVCEAIQHAHQKGVIH
ncbi:MAG: protein kinase, partial [Opitutales bacterium]